MKKIKTLIAVMLVGAALASFTGQAVSAPAKLIPFKIGYVDVGNGFPNDILGIAIDLGYLERELTAAGYAVKTVPFAGAGPAINEALAGGAVDAAITGDVPAAIGKINGIDTTQIAAEIAINDSALVVPANSPINSIRELKGKKIATLEGSYMHHVLLDMLEANALSLKDIKFVSMTSQDAAAAIISNTVDAALLAQIQYAKLVTDGTGKALLAGSSNPKWKGSHAVLVRSAYLKDNAPAAVALVKALVIANDYAKKNREKSIEILAKSGAPIKAIEFLQPGVVDFHVKAGNEVVAAFEGIASFLLDNHLVTRKTDIKAWIDSKYYEAAVK